MAIGIASNTSVHAANVLRIVILNLAARSCASVSGREAMKGASPYASLALPPVLLTDAAANVATTTGVRSAPSTTTMATLVEVPATQRSSSSSGNMMATQTGSDLPLRRHSYQLCARAADHRSRYPVFCSRLPAEASERKVGNHQSGTTPRRARATATRPTA